MNLHLQENSPNPALQGSYLVAYSQKWYSLRAAYRHLTASGKQRRPTEATPATFLLPALYSVQVKVHLPAKYATTSLFLGGKKFQ